MYHKRSEVLQANLQLGSVYISGTKASTLLSVCVCVCVLERDGDSERKGEKIEKNTKRQGRRRAGRDKDCMCLCTSLEYKPSPLGALSAAPSFVHHIPKHSPGVTRRHQPLGSLSAPLRCFNKHAISSLPQPPRHPRPSAA